tara:strand:- start:12733 stop:14097 length:1365 start_codon:yes stop_codon:yes gene_type:complete
MNQKVSIIIRTFNEEDWIGHCLESVFEQDYNNYEVIIVDNKSSDNTIRISKTFPIKKIVSIKKYLPGKSLNAGIKYADGKYLVFLSSHCIPRNNNWLKSLIKNFNNKKIAGVYGRQVPTAFSKPNDVRDLYITFGLDKRIQKKDYFFHNANSAIRMDLWKKYPFDEKLTNIEDRAWAKVITSNGYHLVYEPKAEVFHSHGIHQNQKIDRSHSTIKVLKSIEKFDDNNFLPRSMNPDNINVTAFIPFNKSLYNKDKNRLNNFLSYLKNKKHISKKYLLTDTNLPRSIVEPEFSILKKPNSLNSKNASLGKLLHWALNEINNNSEYPDYILYMNPDYVVRPDNAVQRLVEEACFKGLDSIVYGYKEYSNYFIYNDEKYEYDSFADSLLSKDEKKPVYKGLYGIGCLTKPKIIRSEKLMAKSNIGIIPISNFLHTLRLSKKGMDKIIASLSFGEKYY